MVAAMAISMVGAMALAVPCASAAFLYLPPDETSRDAVPAAGSDIGSTAARQSERWTAEGGASNQEGSESVSPLQVQVTTADARPGAPANGAAEAAAHGTGLWRLSADETLRGVLDRWAGRAGVEVLFLTDRRYRLHEARRFEGSFAEAAQALLAALAHLPHAPAGELRTGGRTLAVLHRARPAGEKQ